MDLLTRRARGVSDLAERFADGVERSETSRLHVFPELDRKKTEKVRRYVGRVSTTLTLHDFAMLSDLMVAASAIELASVDGPWWQLRRTSPVYRRARLAAAADALTRARDYAQAYGAQVLSLVEIADEGMTSEQPPRPMALSSRWEAQAQFDGDVSGDAFDLQPARQQVFGRVEARFSLTQPDLANAVLPDNGG